MTFLAWQRRARAIAAHVRALPDDARAPALAHASVTIVRRASAAPGTPGEPCEPWLEALLSEGSLAAELRALAERHGSAHSAPFVHEHLEHALDPRSRVGANRYATPAPVARWMAREALRAAAAHGARAESADGWLVLDPACGTGALLHAIATRAPWTAQVVCGVERDPTVARGARAFLHGALGLADADTRIQVGDALETTFADRRAQTLVVLANPPFTADGPMSERMRALVHGEDPRSTARYRPSKGEPTVRNAKWLDTAQLRFLRWIHSECDQVERAVAVIALGHAWVDHPTFACVRRALCESFDEVSVLDLHGAARHGLLGPDGERDQNVFEIQQGICLLVLGRGAGRPSRRRADLWGTRASKFAVLERDAIDWAAVDPRAHEHRFEPRAAASVQQSDERRAWDAMIPLDAIFEQSAPAIITGRDGALVAVDRAQLEESVAWLARSENSEIRQRFRSVIDDASLDDLRGRARRGAICYRRWHYRACDVRWAIDERALLDRPRVGPVMDALRTEKTLAIVTRRQCPPERPWNYLFVVDAPACDGLLRADPHGTEVLFSREQLARGALRSNVSLEGLRRFAAGIGAEPSDALFDALFAYVVGSLGARGYGARFGALLARGLPRVALPASAQAMEAIAAEGMQWIAACCGPIEPARGLRWHGAREDTIVERVRWSAARGRLELSERCAIEGVSADELTFEIGARKPALRWLEDRVGQRVTPALIDGYAEALARVRAIQGRGASRP